MKCSARFLEVIVRAKMDREFNGDQKGRRNVVEVRFIASSIAKRFQGFSRN